MPTASQTSRPGRTLLAVAALAVFALIGCRGIEDTTVEMSKLAAKSVAKPGNAGLGTNPWAAGVFSSGLTLAALTAEAYMSKRWEMDCSLLNLLDGDPYCRSLTIPTNRPPVYCFKTLGSVECYASATPFTVTNYGREYNRLPLQAGPRRAAPVQKNVAPIGMAPAVEAEEPAMQADAANVMPQPSATPMAPAAPPERATPPQPALSYPGSPFRQ